MEKTTLVLLAALGAAAATPASANTPPASVNSVLNPTSVADLLEPIADPVATLNALRAQRELEPVEVADDITIGVPGISVHHHHHHHHHRRVIVMHHHHHHYNHHHHHHHHNSY